MLAEAAGGCCPHARRLRAARRDTTFGYWADSHAGMRRRGGSPSSARSCQSFRYIGGGEGSPGRCQPRRRDSNVYTASRTGATGGSNGHCRGADSNTDTHQHTHTAAGMWHADESAHGACGTQTDYCTRARTPGAGCWTSATARRASLACIGSLACVPSSVAGRSNRSAAVGRRETDPAARRRPFRAPAGAVHRGGLADPNERSQHPSAHQQRWARCVRGGQSRPYDPHRDRHLCLHEGAAAVLVTSTVALAAVHNPSYLVVARFSGRAPGLIRRVRIERAAS